MMKRIIALLLALILTVGLLPTVALAADGENPTTDSGSVTKEASKDNLNLVKTVTKEGDNYKVTLESWATGTVTSSSTPVPMDIILLLDQSGSMKKNFTSSSTETYNNLNKKNKKIYADYRNNCYIKSGNQYLKVTVTYQWEFGFSNDVYTYTWNGGSHTSTGGNSKPKIPLFYKSTTNSSTTRIAALKTAVSSFINKVNTEATTKNVYHRVAVVGFASTRSDYYENTELLSTPDVVNYGSANIIDYRNALVSAKTNKNKLDTAINRLAARGDTYPEYGFDMANQIFAQYPIQAGENRQRVVIMFTDGYPAPAGTDDFNVQMANNAINNAKRCKDNNAKVYTIGIFDGADPSASIENYSQNGWLNEAVAANRYMHFSSSNYPSAMALNNGGTKGEGNFYFAASNADALNDIFDTISEEISTDTTTLDGSATIVDNIPGNFTIPAEASDIKVYTAKCTGKTGETLSWEERQASNLKPTTTTNTTTGVKSVSVTGFDYSDEWCGLDENNQPHGSKLIIEFTISHNNYGGTQPTNAGASIKDKENKDVITVDNPSVPVTITEPSITGASENKIYDGEGIDVIANIKAAADTLVTGANMGKNQFVTITVAVKVDKDTTYTYTIPANAEFGSWGTTTPTLTTGKDVNTYEYDLTITYTDATLKTDTTTPADPKTASAKATYTITPAQVTLTSETASKDYDGTALTKPNVTVGGAGATVFQNEVTNIKANGSVTDPGPAVDNTITYTPGANFKATNYNISKTEGKLSINNIAGPTNLPTVTVYCTNGVVKHQDSIGNTLKNNTYTSVVSKNAENKYICTITLTDKNSYISDYNASTGATHTSDTTKTDFTKIILHYDTDAKAWPTPIVNFALNVKCDTPTVNVTYTWDGLDENDFDTVYPAPTKPDDATPNKGSDYTVDPRYDNSSIAIGKDGVRYKFSGWSSATSGIAIEDGEIKNIQTDVTLTGHWTKLGTGTFDLNDKIFKSFEKKQGSKDIPGSEYTFEATVTRLDKENNNQKTNEVYTGTVTLNGATDAAAFVFNNRITFHTGDEYRFLVEETPNTVTTLSSDEQIDYDDAVYYLYVTVSDDLKTINYRFDHVVVITSAEEEPAATENQPITFHNYYYAAKDPGTYDINFSDLVFKVLTKTGDRSFNGAEFTANVNGWRVHKIEIAMVRASAGFGFEPLNSVSLKAAFPADITFEADGKAYRAFTGDKLTVTEGEYLFLIDEINDGQTNITYDESKYWLNLGFVENAEGEVSLAGQRVRKFVDGDTYKTVLALENSEWRIVETSISPVYFENTIDTGKDDYYPIIIPTIINKDTGMLNKTDHFAYVIGYPDGTVHPNGQITRAEVATIFFRLLRDEVRDGAFTTSNTYSDVAYGKWYNNPISTMSALGIITGYPDGTFKPNKPITRAEFAAIAARFDETQSGKSATFSDVIGHWAAKEIGIAYYNDWIKGYPDGTFKPDQNITRAEAMTLINRVLERKPESPADLLTNMNKWTDNMDTSKWYYLDVQEATNSHGYTRKTFNYELWRQMLPDPDWSRYER